MSDDSSHSFCLSVTAMSEQGAVDVQLETIRLLLRSPIISDLDALAKIYANPAIAQYRTNPNPLTREQTQQKLNAILSHWQQHRFGRWAIIDKSSQILIGHAGLEVPPPEISTNPKEAELSYLIAQSHWGQGLATEAAIAILQDGFTRLGFCSIMALVRPENQASIRVAEKLGMVQDARYHFCNDSWLSYRIRYHSSELGPNTV